MEDATEPGPGGVPDSSHRQLVYHSPSPLAVPSLIQSRASRIHCFHTTSYHASTCQKGARCLSILIRTEGMSKLVTVHDGESPPFLSGRRIHQSFRRSFMTAPFPSRLQFSRVPSWSLADWGIGSELNSLRPFSGRSLFPSHRFGGVISAIT